MQVGEDRGEEGVTWPGTGLHGGSLVERAAYTARTLVESLQCRCALLIVGLVTGRPSLGCRLPLGLSITRWGASQLLVLL